MAAIIAISVIVMALLIYALWDSHPRLKALNWLLGWGLAIAAVAAFAVSNRVEAIEDLQAEARERADEERRIASEEKIAALDKSRAEADERAAEALLKLEEIRAKAAAAERGVKELEIERTGLLSQEAWNKIASVPAPSRLGGGIGPCSQNPNAKELAAQLASALGQANWALLRTEFDIPIQGVVVLVNKTHSQEGKDHGQRLFDTLKDAGVDVELIWQEETPMNVPFWVLVGTPRGLTTTFVRPEGTRIGAPNKFEVKEGIVIGGLPEEPRTEPEKE